MGDDGSDYLTHIILIGIFYGLLEQLLAEVGKMRDLLNMGGGVKSLRSTEIQCLIKG
jgi:hypothetical protein